MESEGIPEFLASYTVEIGENLRATLKVTNTGKCAFTYEEALHTYLHVGSTAGAALEGLEGKDYLDATLPGAPRKVQEHAPVRFDGPVDRIYMSRDELTLRDQMLRRSITVSKEGSKRTVVWNPGREAGDAIADLEKGEWNSFVCVEAANCREDAVTLQPGESHILSQTLSVSQG
jgi:glucose-6-phosphate 1-epimerase